MTKLAADMPLTFAGRFRAFCVVVALAAAAVPALTAADSRQNPLVGATREQVLAQFGEPKNTIVAGNREVLLFDRDRVTLRDNVVILVERLPEPVRRPPPESPPTIAATPAGTPADDTAQSPAAKPAAEPDSNATATAANRAAQPATTAAAAPVTPPAPDPRAPLEIKVRPAGAPRPAPKAAAPATATTVPAATDKKSPAATPSSTATLPPPTPATAVAPVATRPVSIPTVATPPSNAAKSAVAPAATSEVAAAPATETPGGAAAADDKSTPKATKTAPAPAREGDTPEEPTVFTGRTYLFAAITIGAGLAFLIWRMRQRQLELAASAVSRTPFSAPVATTAGGAIFTADLLAKLEWKRFEELVAAYYSKTGVVAVRTKAGPASPVQIKISWKGEPRPFALVQCIAQPTGLIDVKPLQDLVAMQATEDIRRGYVVTTGKFNVAARDFAEEKHITLLPGDILLEKINALPDTARNELMQETTAGDYYTTPSCPKCEAKMVKSPDDPTLWRCATHPDQTIRAR